MWADSPNGVMWGDGEAQIHRFSPRIWIVAPDGRRIAIVASAFFMDFDPTPYYRGIAEQDLIVRSIRFGTGS